MIYIDILIIVLFILAIIEGWNKGLLTSMEVVQLVMELNDAFDIEISPIDIVPENFSSLDAINKLVEKCLDE